MAKPTAGAAADKRFTAQDNGLRCADGAREWILAAAVLALAGVVFFFHLGAYGLWEPDEARYAEIAREMLALRDFLLPHLNYVAYVEKPPLLYWLTSLSFAIFGLNEFAARLVPAISGIAGVCMTYLFTARCFGSRRALVAAAILITAPLYAVMAQVLVTDMLLTATITVALFAMFLHYRDGGYWCFIGYAAMALATLTKGPVGIAIPLFTMLIFLWREDQLGGAFRRFHVLAGGAIVLAISAPWFAWMTLKVPGFFDFYFVGEYLRRVFAKSYSHGEPIYFYLPVLIGGLLPWSLMLPFLAWRSMPPNPARRYCTIAALVILIAFSLASAKLIPYILPAFPPLAVLIGDAVTFCAWPPSGTRLGAPDSRILLESGPLLGLLGVAALIAAVEAPLFRSPYPNMVRPALYAAGAVLLAGGVLTMLAFMLNRTAAGISAVVLAAALGICAGTYGRIEAEPLRSYASLCRTIAERAPNATLICYHRYVQALPFYTRRRVILAAPPAAMSELRFGAMRAPDRAQYFFTSDDELIRAWEASGETVIVLDQSELTRLSRKLGPFTEIAREHTKLAIVNQTQQLAGKLIAPPRPAFTKRAPATEL